LTEPSATAPGLRLAQCNIARLQAPIDAPETADFVAALDSINALAEASPGFVWRLQDDSGNATSIQAFDDEMLIVNMSVWESVEALSAFTYRSAHKDVLRRRREWFEPMADASVVLWWVPADTLPTVEEAQTRLESLRRDGPTAEAFTFRTVVEP